MKTNANVIDADSQIFGMWPEAFCPLWSYSMQEPVTALKAKSRVLVGKEFNLVVNKTFTKTYLW